MQTINDDEKYSHKLDQVCQRLNKCSNDLSSSVLTSSILSRDLMSLNSDLLMYDSMVNQLTNDSTYAQEYLSKLEALSIRAQFFEAQLDALEAHTRLKTVSRRTSLNDFKNEVLDWKTTETTLENLYQEFNHLKKQVMQFSHQTPQLVMSPISSSFAFFDSAEIQKSPVEIDFEEANNAQTFASSSNVMQQGPSSIPQNSFNTSSGSNLVPQSHCQPSSLANLDSTYSHQPSKRFSHGNSSSVSTATTSVFDETTNLRPLRCSSRKKRMSSISITSVLNEKPIALRASAQEQFTPNTTLSVTNNSSQEEKEYKNLFSDEADTTVVRRKFSKAISVPSFHDVLSKNYQGDLLQNNSSNDTLESFELPKESIKKSLKHFQSYQGLRILVNEEVELDYGFKFPGASKVATPKITKPKDSVFTMDSKAQTMSWLSTIAENTAMVAGSPSDTPLPPSSPTKASVSKFNAVFNSEKPSGSNDSLKLLTNMMSKETPKTAIGRKPSLDFGAISKSFNFASLNSPLRSSGGGGRTILKLSETPEIEENTEVATQDTQSMLSSLEYPESVHNMQEEKKQWGMIFSKLLSSQTLSGMFEKRPSVEPAIQEIEEESEDRQGHNCVLEPPFMDDCTLNEPIVENNMILIDELKDALSNELSFTSQ